MFNKMLLLLNKMGNVEEAVNELASLEELGSFEEREKIVELLNKLTDESQDQDNDGEEKVEIFDIFQCDNRLCSIFPPFRIEFMKNLKLVNKILTKSIF